MSSSYLIRIKGFTLPLSVASEGAMGRTGSWRTFKPVINYSKCIKCYLCWLHCPFSVISKDSSGVVIDYEYCKGCGICYDVCPTKAIVMVPER